MENNASVIQKLVPEREKQKVFFKVSEISRPIKNEFRVTSVTWVTPPEEITPKASQLSPPKNYKVQNYFLYLVRLGRLSVSDEDHLPLCRQMYLLYVDGPQAAFHPTPNSYCNFKSNTVKSNKKYSMYRRLMSVGQDQWRQCEMRNHTLDPWTEGLWFSSGVQPSRILTGTESKQ